MSQITIDISDRFFSAFGYIPSGAPKTAVIAGNIAEGGKTAGMKYGLDRATQAMITPNIKHYTVNVLDRQFADITLKCKDSVYKFANTLLTEEVEGVLAPAPVIYFSRDKNIVTTNIDGSDAVVVESFGTKQWTISIEGLLIDMDNHGYPGEKIKKLREIFETNAIFDVLDCQLLEDLGIQSLYFKTLTELKFVEDYSDTVSFKTIAHSIKPVEFFI